MVVQSLHLRRQTLFLIFAGLIFGFSCFTMSFSAHASVGFEARPDPVAVRRTDTAPVSVTAGGTSTFVLEVDIDEGWHVNARVNDGKLIPLRITVADSPLVAEVRTEFPPAEQYTFPFSSRPLKVHEGTVRVPVTLKISRDVGKKEYSLAYTVRYQACSKDHCLRPKTVIRTVTVRFLPSD